MSTRAPARCRVIRPQSQYQGKQELLYNVGISAATVGAKAIHLQIATLPPGGRSKAHKHEAHETAIYALDGESGVWHGDNLEHHSALKPGDFFYIPANVPHVPYNPSSTTEVVVLIARTDPNEQESVTLLPELDALLVRKDGSD
jgi:uncharacterized RmlC-like cupin family protein